MKSYERAQMLPTSTAVLATADDLPAALTRDRDVALRTGAVLICAEPAQAEQAVMAGLPAGRILVEAAPAQAAALLAAGWRLIVVADDAAGPHAAAAVGAIACWLGAAAVRTRYVAAVRRAIDMTEAIKGTGTSASAGAIRETPPTG